MLGAMFALVIHLAMLPGAMLWWQQRSMVVMQSTTAHAAISPRIAPPDHTPPQKAVADKPKSTATPPKLNAPKPVPPPNTKPIQQAATIKPPLKPPQPTEPSPPKVQLGRDDADEVYRVGWISYDDFQKLIAPRSTTEQPALQARMTPQPNAPLRGDPTLPVAHISPIAPTPSQPAKPPQPPKPSMASALSDNRHAVTQPPPSAKPPMVSAVDDKRNTDDQHQLPPSKKPLMSSAVNDTHSENPLMSSTIRDTQNAVNKPPPPPIEITPDALALAPKQLAELTGSVTDTLALASTRIKPDASAISTSTSPNRTSANDLNAPATTLPTTQTQSPPTSPSAATSPSQTSPQTLQPAPPLVPDLRMVIVRPDSPTTPAASTPRPAITAAGSDDAFRPSSAPRSDRESPPVSLTDRPVNVRLQPGAVLVGRGVEIKTALPRLSTVARFIPPKNARARLTFDRTGQVLHALFLQSTESESWDGPILASLYQWRAAGKLFDEHPGPFVLEINLIFVRE